MSKRSWIQIVNKKKVCNNALRKGKVKSILDQANFLGEEKDHEVYIVAAE